jgi:uncharacterized protein with HEPN domain
MDMGGGGMSYLSADEQCLLKIEKYTGKIKEAYEQIKEMDSEEIDQGLAGYALAQCLTNLYEVITRVNSDKLTRKLWPIVKRTKATRNIAAHDYDSINWDIVKENCRALIQMITSKFLKDCQIICEAEKINTNDYTDQTQMERTV